MNFIFDDFFAPYKKRANNAQNTISKLIESGVPRDEVMLFDKPPVFPFNPWLNRFYPFYKYVIPKLVAKNRPINVIETGSMHNDEQGCFTLIIGDLIKNWTGGRLYTVDISKDCIEECKKLTGSFSDVIEYIHSDSIPFLQDFNKKNINIDLLMLDSYDLLMPNPHPSMEHHLKELGAIYNCINDETTIAVDDNLGPNSWVDFHWLNDDKSIDRTERIETKDRIIGKSGYIDPFLIANGWKRRKELEKQHENSIYCYELPLIVPIPSP
jgi:hypothetical protein